MPVYPPAWNLLGLAIGLLLVRTVLTEDAEPTPYPHRHSMPVPPAWNLRGLAIGRLCGWNQYNVRWS
jgi:hypothetical protein